MLDVARHDAKVYATEGCSCAAANDTALIRVTAASTAIARFFLLVFVTRSKGKIGRHLAPFMREAGSRPGLGPGGISNGVAEPAGMVSERALLSGRPS